MNINLFIDGDSADINNFVSRIRLLEPIEALAQLRPLTWRCRRPCENNLIDGTDLIIVERAPFRTQEELERGVSVLRNAKHRGIPVAWEIDDHLFCPGLRELIEDSAIDEVDEEVYRLTQDHQELLLLADAFIVSTEPLANAIRASRPNARVFTVPVTLDFQRVRWDVTPKEEPQRGRPLTVGWAGGSRVGRDLEIFVPVLADTLSRNSCIRFLFAGPAKYVKLFRYLPLGQVEMASWVPYDQYPALLARVDIALLPMQDHAYNRCKSALKVIEFGALGIPAICSPVAPYTAVWSDVTHFAANPEQWLWAIENQMEATRNNQDRQTRQRRFRERYHVETALSAYWQIFEKIVESGPSGNWS